MKRGGPLKRYAPLKTKTRLKVKGSSETADLKEEIQALVREIVYRRDGGCLLREVRRSRCGFWSHDIRQADHLITRANSATYADTRLIVCICRTCHGWKKWHQKEYDALVKTILPPERVALWERCEADSWRPHRAGAYDWKIAIAALKQELATYA